MEANHSRYDDREIARRRYKPDKIRWLLIAEAPPYDSDRFFYFENVQTHDRLFLETMHAIYRFECPEISIPIGEGLCDRLPNTWQLRRRKAEFLSRFKSDGFYLIDAADTPMPRTATSSDKRKIIDNGVPNLLKRIRDLEAEKADIILISPRAYRVRKDLEKNGFTVKNKGVIDFPLSSGRKPFLEKMTVLLEPYFQKKSPERV